MSSARDAYEPFFREFDSDLMRQVRREAYGEDIGQHSWVTASELRADVERLRLSSSSRLLDLGCGPCGPLTFILQNVGCAGTGLEFSSAALRAGRVRGHELGVEHLLTTLEGDLNLPLPFESASFEAVVLLDVVVHVRERAKLFREIARVLVPGGRFLFTDAGIVTGPVSNEDVRRRSPHGYTQFVPPGWNEQLLPTTGLRLIEAEDRTASVLANANGRLAALARHRDELRAVLGDAAVQSQHEYLTTLIELSRNRGLARFMFLTEVA